MSELTDIKELFNEEIYKISQKTLVIIPTPWDELAPEIAELLNRILSAVKLDLSAVQILQASAFDDSLIIANKPNRILLFGVSVHLTIEKYQVANFNGIPIIAADSLDALSEDKKKSLWAALRAMFANQDS